MKSARPTFCWICTVIFIVCGYSIEISGISGIGAHPYSYVDEGPSAAVPDAQAGRLGYLITLEVQDGNPRLVSAAEIDNYTVNRHLDAEDDWFLILLNESGDSIGINRIGNPGHYSPLLSAAQALPLTVKIPQLQGLTAVAIFDQHRRELLRIPIDGPFKAQAAANRRQFLAHDRENRRLLAERARMRQAAASEAMLHLDETLRFENLPEELQRKVKEEISAEIEKLEQFGPEVMNLQRNLPIEPEELELQLIQRDHPLAAPALLMEAHLAAKAYTLSGQVTDFDTGAPIAGATLDFWQYDTSNKYQGYLGRQITDATGNYSISVDAGSVTIGEDYSTVFGKRYVRRHEYPVITGNTTWNIKAIPGILLYGTVADSQGKGVAGVNISLYSKDLKMTVSGASGSTGIYSFVVPGNRPLNLSLSTPLPYTPPPSEMGLVFAADTARDFKVETGWLVSGTVAGDGGTPIAGAAVLLRQLNTTTTSCPNWYADTDNNGKYRIAAPKNLEPNNFVISAYASDYLLQSASLNITRDTTQDFQLLRGNTVSGTVRDNSEKTIVGVRVRAYQSGMLVTSALTKSDGTYAFNISAGLYELEALPPAGSSLAPATAKQVSVYEPRTMDFALAPAAGILTVKLYFPDQDAYNRLSNKSYSRFELYQLGLTVYAASGLQGIGGFDPSRGKYFRPYSLYVNDGRYTLISFLLGCQPISLPDIDISGLTAVSLDVPAPFVWTGVLRGTDNMPLANLSIQSYNDLATVSGLSTTNASGQFSIFLTPNGFAKFYTNTRSSNILHTERFGNVTAGRNMDCVLDGFPSFAETGATLTQIYGVPSRSSRWNIVMIGDGYTGIKETFTDTNGNGQWDGVLFYDLNKNGVWNTGEPYQRYGNALAPTAGTDPTLKNEPFTDLNGDGAPNIHDQELFDWNTLDTARSLFGQDEWWKHRDAFNIFRIRLISNQAGHKILDQNRNVVISRDTALGTYLDTPERSYLFNANYTLITQYINQYVPEFDTRIVLVNQPIQMGRVNSYMFGHGGDVPSLCNDYTVAHEMGHNVGLLADEYTEFQETYKGSESASRNVTALTSPAQIPWRHLIAASKEIPSVPGTRGVGLFEGGGYYTGGLYRPTEYCMMVGGNRYCPVCTEQIELRLREITGEVPNATPRLPSQTVSELYPEFSWDALAGVSHYLLELEKADGSQLVASYDVYDTSFILPFQLSSGTDYRWRIRPGSTSRWGDWSSWVYFRQQSQTPAFTSVFAHIAAGGGYQTILTGINTGQVTAKVLVSLFKSDGTPFDLSAGGATGPVNLNIKPMGTTHIEASLPGNTVSGYARLASDAPVGGTALFKTLSGTQVLSEACVGLSKPGKSFTVYVDNVSDAISGYAVANFGESPANITLTLRDTFGSTEEVKSLTLLAGQQIPEFAYQRFAAAQANFEGSIEVSSDQNLAAVALRFDNPTADVFSTIPVLVDEPNTTLYFPQVADGGGYRTNFILVNPSGTPTSATLAFFANDGTPLALPIGGVLKTSHSVPLNAKGVSRFVTDGSSSAINAGWVKVTCPVAITGSSIFQTRFNNLILSEAGVGSSPLAQHLAAYVESSDSTQSGLAICNPNSSVATLTLNLRNSSGDIVAATSITLPANGHLAKFVTEWFPRGFGEFEGTLEVLAAAAVSAVALRYDNPQQNVFATLPVIIVQ